MPFFRITLLRSAIGLPKPTRAALRALGLKKRMATVFRPVNASTAGQIMKLKELVAVSEVDRMQSKEEVKAARRPDPGFVVEEGGVLETMVGKEEGRAARRADLGFAVKKGGVGMGKEGGKV